MSNQQGNPSTWITKDRSDRRSLTQLRKQRNQAKFCSLKGCSSARAGLSRYCRRHADRIRDIGDPIATVPTVAELDIVAREVERWIRHGCCPTQRDEIEQELHYQSRRITRPKSWAVNPGDMHRRISQRGRAEIVKATAGKHGANFRDWLIRAAAVEAWAMLHFDGLPEFRKRFIQTQSGSWATQRGTPSRSWTMPVMHEDTTTILYTANGPKHPMVHSSFTQRQSRKISGAVQRLLGADAIAASKQALQPNGPLWDQPVPSTNGQDQITLLNAIKFALREARGPIAKPVL